MKNKKCVIICLIIVVLIAILSHVYVLFAFQKDLVLPNANDTFIDVKYYDSGKFYSIENTKDKQELLDLMKSKIKFLKLKARTNYQPIDSLHHTYSIIVRSNYYSGVFYVSSLNKEFCFLDGQHSSYYITNGDLIANYLNNLLKVSE